MKLKKAIGSTFGICVLLIGIVSSSVWGQEPALSERLTSIDYSELVRMVEQRGDAARGAILFHQPLMQCSQCHAVDDGSSLLGPNLAKWEPLPQKNDLLESILKPSQSIRQGFETIAVLTVDDQVVTGLLVRQNDQEIVLKDASQPGKLKRIVAEDVEQISKPKQSIMPEGAVNQLGGVDQFLDLAKYVFEVAELGPSRAAELQPNPALVSLPPLPEYETHVDHAGLISRWDNEAFQRGSKIYRRVCANCHGTLTDEGSLPTSPRFASSKLKNGHAPFRLYQTLTHGHGLMVAQRWMVPQQKYDVIHYIRETFFKEHNTDLYVEIDQDYLSSLPAGDTFGPEPSNLEPYVVMDYGPSLMHTYEITLNNSGDNIGRDLGRNPSSKDPWANPDKYFLPGQAPNYAYKGIAVRLDTGPGGVTRGRNWMVYDHDTLNMHAAWAGDAFIDYCCIQFDGQHNVHNRLTGEIEIENPVGPGWAQPLTGSFHDPRPVGRDGRPYGPLPTAWCEYRGLYHYGARVILSYRVGEASVLESPDVQISDDSTIYVRNLTISPAGHRTRVRLGPTDSLQIAVRGDGPVEVTEQDGFQVLEIGPHDTMLHLAVLHSSDAIDPDVAYATNDLRQWTKGGPPRWATPVQTSIQTAFDSTFRVDEMTLPENNPWNARLRVTGIDFFEDGKTAALCTWDGDVWVVQGIDQPSGSLTWRRIASGMFQPLGIKISDGEIYLTCRDQLVRLHDLNADGETDFYECFNHDHQVTEHFHEFAMGLQQDSEGNFYYAKSGRHAKRAVVPHHGTLLKVSPDGKNTDIIATGFRAANGVCLNPDGTFFVTDQEGHWNPKNRINWVRESGFYGNMYSFTDVVDVADDAMEQPLCWITNDFDRSPAELLWVPEDAWGALGGKLLNLSYGYGKIFVVPHETVNGMIQGGMIQLPIPDFPSGLIRGRFLPNTDDLFVGGMFSWAGSRQAPGCFYRVRYQNEPSYLPVGLNATANGMRITFSHSLENLKALNTEDFEVRAWDLKRTPNYGSKHYNERTWQVESVRLSGDGTVVELTIPDIEPTWGMSIEYEMPRSGQPAVRGLIHNTIHQLADPKFTGVTR